MSLARARMGLIAYSDFVKETGVGTHLLCMKCGIVIDISMTWFFFVGSSRETRRTREGG